MRRPQSRDNCAFVEIVGKLAHDDQVEAAVGPVVGDCALLDLHVAQMRDAAARQFDGVRVEIGGEQCVAARSQRCRQFTGRAAGFVGPRIAFVGQHRERQRPLAPLVPPLAQQPRIVAAFV